MAYVFSKLTGAQDYTFYAASQGGGLNKALRVVHINGGANVADKNLVTPDGVMTSITNDELELLQSHPIFKLHVEKGYVKVLKSNDAEKAKKDMQVSDDSAPLTPSSYEKRGKRAPKSKE